MKIFKNILKWIGRSIGSLLILTILAGLAFRLFGPEPHQPMGKLVDVGGFKLHIHSVGVKNDKPTLVIEGGAGMATEHYHWLSEGLKDTMRVVRYDRAGIGYSESSDTPRDPETVARELHTLLERAGESPPYIMAGHSFGGPYLRVFTQLYPDEVDAMIFIDCTHPERVERFDLPKASSTKFKVYLWTLHAQGILCDLGIVGLYDRMAGPILAGDGLPEEINARMLDFSLDGKYAHSFTKEMKHYHSGLKRSGEANHFGSIPIRVFGGVKMQDESFYRERGIDPAKLRAKEVQTHEDFAALSTNGKVFLMDADHNSIYTKKENAEIICNEIIKIWSD